MIVILVAALLVFGPKRLPDLARSLGKGMAEFRRASNDLRRTLQEAEREVDSASTPPDEPNRIAPPEASVPDTPDAAPKSAPDTAEKKDREKKDGESGG